MQVSTTRRSRSLVFGVLLLLFGSYLVLTFQMPLGTFANPGPGFFPVIIGIMGLLSSLSLLPYLWRAPETPINETTAKIPKESVILGCGVIAYAALMYFVGFVVATAAYTLFILRRYSTRGWIFSSLIAVVFAALLYLVFSSLLNVNLP